MKVVRVLGSEKCYEFEDGEKVAFIDKKRYMEKRGEDANKKGPAEHAAEDRVVKKNDSPDKESNDGTEGRNDKEVVTVNGAGRKDIKANGTVTRIRGKKGRKRKASSP